MKFTRNRAALVMGLVALLAVGATLLLKSPLEGADAAPSTAVAATPARRLAVSVAPSRRGDVDIIVTALGTVTARDTVTVRSRVEGQLLRVHFREGQQVKAGDLLAEIDPRPFQIALEQAERAAGARQRAARQRATRCRALPRTAQTGFDRRQQVDAQVALVHQYTRAWCRPTARRSTTRVCNSNMRASPRRWPGAWDCARSMPATWCAPATARDWWSSPPPADQRGVRGAVR
jgi:multidrug efflux pump subunit AcrA (membrane-fusion protein)